MKKQLFTWLALALFLPGIMPLAAQTTEGTNFWLTFLQADHRDKDNKSIRLSLIMSSRESSEVTIDNPFFQGKQLSIKIDGTTTKTVSLPFKITLEANVAKEVQLYEGTAKSTSAANEFCYSRQSEIVDKTAVHVTATKPISLYAINYKPASFDATNILPYDALQRDYLIQCFTPSDHKSEPQGSHFAVIATENNTVVKYCPTVRTQLINTAIKHKNGGYTLSEEEEKLANFQVGDTLTSEPLQAGQVWYVWTDDGEGHSYDLSGTRVFANKNIAVLQGNPHTNLPYYGDFGLSEAIQQREHLFSQAMPLSTWGNTFAVTASSTRKRDVIRVMAIEDNTEVRINGELVHTFDFSQDTKQYWEFQLGEKNVKGGKKADQTRPDPDIEGSSCLIETSCPAAVHLFVVSQQWDGSDSNYGDPSMLWVNPIEQKIDQITFATYPSRNDKGENTRQYVNVVTDSANVKTNNRMILDDAPLTGWQPVLGSDENSDGQYRYYFVQHDLGETPKSGTAESHTLRLDNAKEGDGFIAHVYGFTSNESYAYNAGGFVKILSKSVKINGTTYSSDVESDPICEKEAVTFDCLLNFEYENITWDFGDGQKDETGQESIVHHYAEPGTYNASVIIRRDASTVCRSQSNVDTIPLKVIIGDYKFEITEMESIPCKNEDEEMFFRVFYNNEAGVNMEGDNAIVEFDEATIAAGFRNRDLVINQPDSYFRITIPVDAEANKSYGIRVAINDGCVSVDTVLHFMVSFDAEDVMVQRYDNILGLNIKYYSDPDKTYSDFQWYKNDVLMEGENEPVLNMRSGVETESEFLVCYVINKGQADELRTCSCPKRFKAAKESYNFDPDGGILAPNNAPAGGNVFVNVDYGRGEVKANESAKAEWITMDGTILATYDLPDHGTIISAPTERNIYILRVTAGKLVRNFKFLVY